MSDFVRRVVLLVSVGLIVGEPASGFVESSAQTTPTTAPSEAERITDLQKTIQANQALIAERRRQLDDPDNEFARAQEAFRELDAERRTQRDGLEALRATGSTGEVARAEEALAALEQRWTLARERLDLALEQRKTIQQQIQTLETTVAQDQAKLDQLLGVATTQPTTQPAAPTPPSATTPPPTSDAAPNPAPAAAPGQTPAAAPTAPAAREPSAEEQAAEAKVAEKQQAAQAAQAAVQTVAQQLEQLRADIAAEQKLLDTAEGRAANARTTSETLVQQLNQRRAAGAGDDELRALRADIAGAAERRQAAEADVAQSARRLADLRARLADLEAEQTAASEAADEVQAEAEQAAAELAEIRNPFAPRNILRWFAERGPRILAILVGMIGAVLLTRVIRRRIVHFLVMGSDEGSRVERENRANTLTGVFGNVAFIAIIVGGTLTILREAGLDILPLLGAAGVLGLAIAFGAQNLVRDYFAGFMILLENQYGVNDVIVVGDLGGLVEKVTLRVTVLRGLDGTAHFIPNGEITRVSNMTHTWSRALFDIGVSYNADVDQVMGVLMTLGKEIRTDPKFRRMILDDPEMLGVDEFSDSAVIIKFFIKTRPLQQWNVKRELLRRIKKKFDELGIEIPFPHRTIYHRGLPTEMTPHPLEGGPGTA